MSIPEEVSKLMESFDAPSGEIVLPSRDRFVVTQAIGKNGEKFYLVGPRVAEEPVPNPAGQ